MFCWSEVVGSDGDTGLDTVSYVEIVIKNTTSEASALASALRTPLFRSASE